jgi:hypothetical protein
VGSRHFFIVGAQRSGTTYLYQLLDSHPEIEMAVPVRPEPKFFLRDDLFERGLSYYDTTFFVGKPGARLRGEKTVSYMESDKAAQRISQCYPGAQIVFVLRDPIERALSHYWFSVENGVEGLPLERALLPESEQRNTSRWGALSMSPFAYLQRGCYLLDMARYEMLFGRERLHVLLYEELTQSLRPFRALCEGLGVSGSFTPAAKERPSNLRNTQGEAPPRAVRARLAAYFEEPTEALAAKYGLDVGVWTRNWPRAG